MPCSNSGSPPRKDFPQRPAKFPQFDEKFTNRTACILFRKNAFLIKVLSFNNLRVNVENAWLLARPLHFFGIVLTAIDQLPRRFRIGSVPPQSRSVRTAATCPSGFPHPRAGRVEERSERIPRACRQALSSLHTSSTTPQTHQPPASPSGRLCFCSGDGCGVPRAPRLFACGPAL